MTRKSIGITRDRSSDLQEISDDRADLRQHHRSDLADGAVAVDEILHGNHLEEVTLGDRCVRKSVGVVDRHLRGQSVRSSASARALTASRVSVVTRMVVLCILSSLQPA